uniref:vWA domain-containing protein n=1 Tax=Eubacterium cellulosolvens TaxID=29322 RepID=UPI000489A9F8|nr:VWA domain-containing protein [[Eubacterium] cellulosolvens]
MTVKPIFSPVLIGILAAVLCGLFAYFTIRKKYRIHIKIAAIVRVFLILLLVFVINLRPVKKVYDLETTLNNVDVLFVVDTTISMWAEDYQGDQPRMNGVRELISHVAFSMPGSNFGLIRFDNQAQILAPFTGDAESVLDAVEMIETPSRLYAKGSTLDTAYEAMEELLQSSAKKENRQTVVFFLSDGENTLNKETRSFAELAGYITDGSVIGCGTKKGGKMKDGNGSRIHDPQTYEDAVSKMDEKNLMKIAGDLGISYTKLTSENCVDYVVSSIKSTGSSHGQQNIVNYTDTYYWYVIPLAGLLIWELWLIIRKGRV